MINEALGWLWVVIGFASGILLGVRFQRDDWLGGYSAFPRRLIRLGHISFLGLGFLNILFALSVGRLHLNSSQLLLTSWALIAGAVTMPICCFLTAWKRASQPLFAVPVLCLVTGGILILAGLVAR